MTATCGPTVVTVVVTWWLGNPGEMAAAVTDRWNRVIATLSAAGKDPAVPGGLTAVRGRAGAGAVVRSARPGGCPGRAGGGWRDARCFLLVSACGQRMGMIAGGV